ncbi:hypothetical protein HYPSUDRAFT_751380 [Hypholoma sublateritium FD-334 SS-4]|uniref:Uncharacterized protein n=1 Tax=Hypholoma sublateritium (strain FD-334 SS-4) TaxID=945553 RepID=A0A0D2NR31_HYPSF|nr:hypothetical protein HYPSUDRAFT_751380 [Hypholoma sublateritium FD-334 SS-4]
MSETVNNFAATPDVLHSSVAAPTYPPPSQTAPTTHTDTVSQQDTLLGSTSSGDGQEARTHKDLPNPPVSSQQTENVPFKERVVGVAEKTRGTLFGNSGLKEHGQAILDGRASYKEKDRD